MHLEIQLIFFHYLGLTLKNRSKVKKRSESIKNDTKAGIMRVWNELQPKLLHKQLPFNGCLRYIFTSLFLV